MENDTARSNGLSNDPAPRRVIRPLNRTCLSFAIIVWHPAIGSVPHPHAQAAAPARSGVVMGHLHLAVKVIATPTEFWARSRHAGADGALGAHSVD